MQIKPKSRWRRIVKISVIFVVVIALASLGLHIWFVNNARRVIKNMVATRSHGKVNLELSGVSFNIFANKFQVRQATLVSTDTLTAPVGYRVKFNKLTLRIGSLWDLILHKKLFIDSVKLYDPDVTVTQFYRDSTASGNSDGLSITQEMGKLYNSMLDGFDAFGVRRILISNARVTLINKIEPGIEPVVISNIGFSLLRTPGTVGRRDQFVANQQTVDFQTTGQDIALPGGKHRISFRSFNLHLFNRRIELDSCTIITTEKDSTKSGYKVFFNKLLLVGVDFDAMYQSNLIKADSVYCEYPVFDLRINTKPGDVVKNERPDPWKIIREMTGDLDIAFIGVKDAGIHLTIRGKETRSLFNSNQDDFEMRDLHINADSAEPVSVGRFDMLVRDYHLYNEDSSLAYTFDSIQFRNNKILLNNFSRTTLSGPGKIQSERDFRIPYFELAGLDWSQLIFEENLVAREAVLYNPVINYVKRTSRRTGKKRSIFASIQTLDDFISLHKLTVSNGQINMKLGPSTSIQLQDANISLYSNRLQESVGSGGLKHAFEALSFYSATIHLKDITATIQNARNSDDNLLHADKLMISDRTGRTEITANDISLQNFSIDEDNQAMSIDGLKWNSAKVSLLAPAVQQAKGKAKGTSLRLQKIKGNNTDFHYSNGKIFMTTFIDEISIDSLSAKTGAKMKLSGIIVAGKRLMVKGNGLGIAASSYRFNGQGPSFLTGADIRQVKDLDTLLVKAPRINFDADLVAIMNKDIHLRKLEAAGAVVHITKWARDSAEKQVKPLVRVDNAIFLQPAIEFSSHRNDSVMSIRVPRSENGNIKFANLHMDNEGIRLGSLAMRGTGAKLIQRTGQTIGVDKGKMDVSLSNLQLSTKEGRTSWAALLNSLYLDNPEGFVIGNKQQLQIGETTVGDLQLSSDYIGDFKKLLKFNISAWLRTSTGQYRDSAVTLRWRNADYNSGSRILSLDSFEYHPTLSRDSMMITNPFQADYITLKTGSIKLTGFNLSKYEKDSALTADTMQITNPEIIVYRDKLPPLRKGGYKPLPVDMIKLIPLPIDVNKIKIVDGNLSYTERHPKSRNEGTLFLTHINAGLSNIKNHGLRQDDSLLLAVDAYLMDSALLHLVVKESYLDTLSGFLMTLTLKPRTLAFLNPVLLPLSNVKITSGTIDSFNLRAIGRENLAIGEMHMYYHDLRVKLIRNGDETKSGLVGSIGTFLANTFFVKKNNRGRTGIIYYERLKDRSFFNYIVKMSFSGMATSIGAKSNRKYLKQYKRELKKQNLPPVNLD